MGSSGAVAIAHAASQRPQLRELYLDDNDLSSSEAIGAVAKLIAGNTTLKVLALESNHIDSDGARVLSSALAHNSTLEVLLLSDNTLGDNGVGQIVTVLATSNTTLKRLTVNNCDISNSGAKQLAEFMATQSCSLREVEFHGNRVTADGLKQVQDSLRFSKFEEADMLSFKQKARLNQAPTPVLRPMDSYPPARPRRLGLFGIFVLSGILLGAGFLFMTHYKKKKDKSP